MNNIEDIIIPIAGMLTGIIIPLAAFLWLYRENKNKYAAVVEISKNLDNPSKAEELIKIFEDRKKEPIDYRRSGVITLFVGIGIYFLGVIAMGRFFEAAGCSMTAGQRRNCRHSERSRKTVIDKLIIKNKLL